MLCRLLTLVFSLVALLTSFAPTPALASWKTELSISSNSNEFDPTLHPAQSTQANEILKDSFTGGSGNQVSVRSSAWGLQGGFATNLFVAAEGAVDSLIAVEASSLVEWTTNESVFFSGAQPGDLATLELDLNGFLSGSKDFSVSLGLFVSFADTSIQNFVGAYEDGGGFGSPLTGGLLSDADFRVPGLQTIRIPFEITSSETLVTISIGISVAVGQNGTTTTVPSYSSAFLPNTISFPISRPVFLLPAGVRIDSPGFEIVDNQFVGPVPSLSPPELPALNPLGLASVWVLLGLAGWRRLRTPDPSSSGE